MKRAVPSVAFLLALVSISCGMLAWARKVVLTWTQSVSPGIVSNCAYRSEVSGGPYQQLGCTPSPATTYTDETIVSGHPYYYVVTAKDATQESVFSAESPVAEDPSFYVSLPTNTPAGSDANPGTIDAPFATVDHARQAVQGVCSIGLVNVILRAGTYYQANSLASPLTFSGGTASYPSTPGTNDNGCSAVAPIIYQSYAGESAVISGGRRATGWATTGFTAGGTLVQYSRSYTGPYIEAFWYRRAGSYPITGFAIASNAVTFTASNNANAGDIVSISGLSVGTYLNGLDLQIMSATAAQFTAISPTADFTHADVGFASDSGTAAPQSMRRFRPRLGATSGNNKAAYLHVCAPGTCGGAGALVEPTDACSLSTNGCNGATNAGCTQFSGHCWDRMRVPAGVPLATWGNLTVSGSPTCDVEAMYWEIWTVPILRVCAVDLVNNLIIFSSIMQTGFGVGTSGGPLDGHRFMIENEKDSATNAITLPQQWLLDRTTGPPTLYYNAAPGENPNTDIVEIPALQHAAIIYNAQFLTFRRLTFAHDNWTVPAAGYLSFQGETTIWAAVTVQSSQNINFENSTVAHTSGDGIEFFPCRTGADGAWCLATDPGATTAKSSFRSGSSAFDIGVNGIQIGSKTIQATDTDANVANSVSVYDSLVRNTGRRVPSAFGISVGSGHDLPLWYNDINYTYHAGIAVCVPPCAWGTANSHGVYNVNSYFNKLHNLTQAVVSDIGGLYYATGYGAQLASGACGTSNRIISNLVYDVTDPNALPGGDPGAQGGHGIYLDNLTCGLVVQNNGVWRVSSACIKISKGIPLTAGGIGSTGQNTIVNNIFDYCRLSAIETGTPSQWESTADYTPAGNCAVNQGNTIRLMFTFARNLISSDRNDASAGGGMYFQRGCVDSCGATYTATQLYQGNQWWNTSVTLSTYAKAFHVTHATASPIGPGNGTCGTQPADWDFATPANWQCAGGCSFTDSAGGGSVPVVIPHEDAGAAFADPGFISPGYPNDNYRLSGPPAIAGFNFAATNLTQDMAGRLTNKSFNPLSVETFPTSSYDTGHTNNGEY